MSVNLLIYCLSGTGNGGSGEVYHGHHVIYHPQGAGSPMVSTNRCFLQPRNSTTSSTTSSFTSHSPGETFRASNMNTPSVASAILSDNDANQEVAAIESDDEEETQLRVGSNELNRLRLLLIMIFFLINRNAILSSTKNVII